jgi:hypothetical protein
MRSDASLARPNQTGRRRAGRLEGWPARIGASTLSVLIVGALVLTHPAASGPGASVSSNAAIADECIRPQAAPGPEGRPARVALQPVFTKRGEQLGRRLEVETRRGDRIAQSLAAESFTGDAGPDHVVFGQALAQGGSEVRLLSLETGCSLKVFDSPNVVRSALADPAGTHLYIHSVKAATRADAGVSRIELAGRGEDAELVLEPFRPDAEFGLVYSTQMIWGGSSLAVQSCGAERCITRILDVAAGTTRGYEAEQGAIVGLTSHDLIAFSAEDSRPADLLAIDRTSGVVRTLAEEVLEARMAGDPPRAITVITPAGEYEVSP